MNGVSKSSHLIAENLTKKKINFEIWGITPSPEVGTFKRIYKLFLFKLNKSRFFLDPLIKKKIDQLDTNTLVHFNGTMHYEYFMISRLLKIKKINWIISPRGALNKEALKNKKILKWIYINIFEKKFINEAKKIHCLANNERKEIIQRFKQRNIVVIPNGFDFKELIKNKISKKTEFKRNKILTLGFVGRIHHLKGLDIFIKGLHLYSNYSKKFKFYIVGRGPQESEIQRLINKYNLNKFVIFLGEMKGNKKFNFIKKLDYFIHTSRSEGISNSILESLALGVPVIISKETNMKNEIISNNCGFVLKKNNPKNISINLVKALNVKIKSFYNMKKNSQKLINNNFNWETIIKIKINKLYN